MDNQQRVIVRFLNIYSVNSVLHSVRAFILKLVSAMFNSELSNLAQWAYLVEEGSLSGFDGFCRFKRAHPPAPGVFLFWCNSRNREHFQSPLPQDATSHSCHQNSC